MNSQMTRIDPREFLETVFAIDEIAAVRIASRWGAPEADRSQYQAAWDLVSTQTIYPRCSYCEWPLLPSEDHEYCETQIQERRLAIDAGEVNQHGMVDDDVDDDIDAWYDPRDDDPDDIDDASRAEIEHGQRMGML